MFWKRVSKKSENGARRPLARTLPFMEALEQRQYLSVAPNTVPVPNVVTHGATITSGNIIATGAAAGGYSVLDAFSATTQQLLWSQVAYTTRFQGGVHVAAGTLVAGQDPVVVAAPAHGGYPLINVYDGYTGALLHQFYAFDGPHFTGGVNLAIGDVTGNGTGDIIVGANSGGEPLVNVYSGSDFSLITSFLAFPHDFAGGVRLAAGDVQAIGRDDIIAGAGFGGLPVVNVFNYNPNATVGSIATTEYESFFAYAPTFHGGVWVAAGNVTGHGEDIITDAGFGGGPDVRVFEGPPLTAQPIPVQEFNAFDPSFTGAVRVASTDVNGDGYDDIIAGPGPGILHRVRIFSGANDQLLTGFHPFGDQWLGGVFVAASGHQ